MEFSEYEHAAQRTAGTSWELGRRLSADVLGLASEAGEVCGLFQKARERNVGVLASEVLDELGDVLWRITDIAVALGSSLSEVAVLNVMKLQKRHPNGFDANWREREPS